MSGSARPLGPLSARAQRLVRSGWYARVNIDVLLEGADSAAHFEAFGYREGRDPNILFSGAWYRDQAGSLGPDESSVDHYLTTGWTRGIDPGPLFDSAWYVAQAGGSLDSDMSPLEHYVLVGSHRDLSPHPLFDAQWYRSQHPDLDLAGTSAYEYFLEMGWKNGDDPSPLFDTHSYLSAYQDIARAGVNPFVHYVTSGIGEGRQAATLMDGTWGTRVRVPREPEDAIADISVEARMLRLFRPSWYLFANPDVRESSAGPLRHYTLYGRNENRSASALFDSEWYHRQFPTLPDEDSMLEHYLLIGGPLGASPSPAFSTEWYLRQWGKRLPDDCTALEHYVSVGWALGLDPHPLFSGAWYIERNPSLVLDGLTPLEHFLERGWRREFEPGPMFNPASYLALNKDVELAGENPFIHFLVEGLAEGRPTSTMFDANWYAQSAFDDPLTRHFDPLSHFIHFGAPIGRRASADPLAAALADCRLAADRRSRSSFIGSVTTNEVGGEVTSARIDWNRRLSDLDIPTADPPLVSVVIPTFNHSEDVIRCLESVSGSGDTTAFEIIVVDDASDDLHADRFRNLSGVRTVRLDDNEGFAGACTAGVAEARGNYILLLNNDTEVLPGWIDALVAELVGHPHTGIVGSMIVRPDFLLQEAGCVMWADGNAWQYGSGQTPLDFKYRYRREVDYCSGASLLIRRTLWNKIGGFDDRFSPAYYEDADICFEARRHGFAVVYEPGSVLVHNEGSSHGTDGSGTKRFQFRNKEVFRQKWELSLLGHGLARDAADGVALLRLRDRRRSNHVVVVDHRVPAADQDAGSQRMFRLIEGLITSGHVVHFLPADRTRHAPWTQRLEQLGVEFITGKDPDVIQHLRAISSMTDLVLVSRPEVLAEHISLVLAGLPTVPLAFDMVDAHAQRIRRSAAMHARPELEAEAMRLQRLETAAARIADVVVVVSKSDEDFIVGLAGIPLETVCIPTIHYAEDFGPGYEERDGLLFVGGYEHPPNVDAARFLVHEVLPLIRARIGNVRLVLAGSKPPAELTSLVVDNVTVTGWVPNLRPLYDKARVSVAPLRFGAGVKGKIGESLSYGIPTVTTSIGVEGIDLVEGRDILVGDSPEAFAERVAHAYSDRAVWEGLRENGAAAIERQFGKDATAVQIKALVDAAARVDLRADRHPRNPDEA